MLHRHGGDIYSYDGIRDFSANINYRGMPAAVAEAAVRAVEASVHYPDPDYRALRAAIAAREGVDDARVICGNGAAELMFALAAAKRPKRALLAVPSFFEYEQALSSAGCEVDYFYLNRQRGFCLDASFADAVDGTADLVVLGNPNNPTGQVIRADVLNAVLESCRKNGTFLVLDESFFDFLYGEDRAATFSGTDRIGTYGNLFVLRSFTKMYAMPGLRFGYGICPDEKLLERMRGVMQPWNVSLPASSAAQAACMQTEFAEETARLTAVNRQEMRQWMEEAGYEVFGSGANFLLFTGADGLEKYCANRGFLIRNCSNFPGLEPTDKKRIFYRICVRSSEENAELMEVLRAFASKA